MISSSAERARESSTAPRISSTRPSASSRKGTPRKITSGSATSAVLLGHGGYDDEDAVAGEHPPVAQRDVAGVADVHAVDEDHPGLLALYEAGALPVDLERQAVLAPEHVLAGHAHGSRQLGVQAQAAVVAVDGQHVARVGQVDHQLELLGVAVARGVDGRVARCDHVGAEVIDAVDRLVHGALVAGDRGGEDHRVPFVQRDVGVVEVGHAAQGRQGLALAPRGDDHERGR